jgi:hypothetical protein
MKELFRLKNRFRKYCFLLFFLGFTIRGFIVFQLRMVNLDSI